MKVKNIMHKGIEWVLPGTPVTTVAQKMKRSDVGAIPVADAYTRSRRDTLP
jgi:CBS domain-containing protein